MPTDKRIIKTRTSIKKAFIELVEERAITKISVSDLAAQALVNRSTFYLHYEDVAAVAADIDKEIEESISACMDDFTISDIYGSTYAFFKNLTKRLDENESMKRYIIFSTNSGHVVAKIKEILVKKTTDSLLKKFPDLKVKEINYTLTFVAAGVMDCYINWVKNNEGNTLLDDLIKEISSIIEYIISGLTNSIQSE